MTKIATSNRVGGFCSTVGSNCKHKYRH